MSVFKDHGLRDGDLCARRLREDRYEVCVWRGDLETGSWVDQRSVSLAELNKFVRSQTFLGKAGDWEYYRPPAH